MEPLCVIDLDTVMPGAAAYDFGDSIRFGANTAAEDECDLSLVSLSLPLFEAYARGFLGACGAHLTEAEKQSLQLGSWMMTMECGARFLTDYLDGDVYFSIHRPEHNLDRLPHAVCPGGGYGAQAGRDGRRSFRPLFVSSCCRSMASRQARA